MRRGIGEKRRKRKDRKWRVGIVGRGVCPEENLGTEVRERDECIGWFRSHG